MGDIRVYTEVAILSFTHLQVLISWQTLLTAIITKLTVDSCDTGRPSMQSESLQSAPGQRQLRRAYVCTIIFLLYEFYISTKL